MKYAGKDATDAFNPVHPPGVIDAQLPKDKHLGELDRKDVKRKEALPKTRDELRMEREQRNKPPLSKMHNLRDLEVRTKIESTNEVITFLLHRTSPERFYLIRLWPTTLLPPMTKLVSYPPPLYCARF